MQKTKLGISAALMVGILYLLGLYSGYLITTLAVAYVLWKEDDLALKKQSVRVLALMLTFSVLSTVITLLPNLCNVISGFLEIFRVHYYFSFFHRVAEVFSSILNLLEKVVFVGLGVLAVLRRNVSIPVLDKLIDKYITE